MKITCQSCQSKYNVADEKVQGKIVKIRCRKCGATIVVNGTGGAAASTNGTSSADGAAAPGGAQWHVNVGDNDQRTMTMPELVDAYNAGVITQDTFIWTDGMDDWRPLAEVEPVVSALHASAGQMAIGTPGAFETPGLDAAAAAAAAPMAAAHGGDVQGGYGESAYGGGDGYGAAAAAPAAEPKRAAVAKRDARARDLFATNVGDEIQTSAPAVPEAMGAAPAAGGGLTGQRNENSVLFSLAVLTKNADQRAPQEQQTTANREDSGLIDLKALAAKAESVRPPAGAADGDVFTAPIGGFGAPLGAPVGALSPLGTPEAQQKSKLPLYIGGGGGMLVLLVLGIVIGVKLAGPAPVPAPTVSVAATVAAPSATADPSAAASASASPEASASAAPAPSVAAKPKWTGGGGGYHPHPSAAAGGGGGSGGGAAATPPPAPAPKKGGGDCGCNGDLMCLMKCSTH